MADNPLLQLDECGQSVWLDYIRRSFVQNGDLQKMIDEGVTGVTSNPSIFEKAITGSSDYDDQFRSLVEQGKDIEAIYQTMTTDDVQAAADVLRPLYDASNGERGYVSIEVSPAAAHNLDRTLADAHAFWTTIDRPNVMIKVPATPEGIPAIEQLISEGINVNITLIFAVEVYEQVMEAYLRGLERRSEGGGEINRIASVASFFVSRVDTLVDSLLEERAKGADAGTAEHLKGLEGKAAIANAKIAYEAFQRVFEGERFGRLAAKGARVQKPLWASTSTKNPAYPDTLYVEPLVGPHTVNTMPQQTITAVLDHGHIQCGTVMQDVDAAHRVFAELQQVGISMRDVTDKLTVDGVKQFVDALQGAYAGLEEKAAKIREGEAAQNNASLNGLQPVVDAALETMASNNAVSRLWKKDPALWKPNPSEQNEITDRLGWLHVSDCMQEHLDRFTALQGAVRDAGYTHAVVLGMGGSSLAPYVFSQSFGRQEGYPELLVLDSTDPLAVLDVERTIDFGNTLFIVSSKSGTTTETLSQFSTFWQRVYEARGDRAGEQFVAVTDPGTPLEELARQHGFRACYLNPTDIGGRYSAMSYFGLIPAAVMGLDIGKLVDRAMRMEHACAASVPAEQNPGAWLGTIMAQAAKRGRDKVTFFLSSSIETLGLWLEQLLAESTGKEGTGLVPVPDNPPGDPSDYADDHLFVLLTLDGDEAGGLDGATTVLEEVGNPIVRLRMADKYDLGAEFFRWEFATAVAGAQLGINAFDQPNVQESKDNTKRILKEMESDPDAAKLQPLLDIDGIQVFANDEAKGFLQGNQPNSLPDLLQAFLWRVTAPKYLAIQAYLAPSPEHDHFLYAMRAGLRDALRVAVTMGYGPRYLHSTGQLHKGGPPEGVFLQITARADADESIPGSPFSFATLIEAQALGDFQSLQAHGRPALRVHLPDESRDSLQKLQKALQPVLSSQFTAAGE